MKFKKIQTPVGELMLVASDRGVRALLWENDHHSRVSLPENMESSESSPMLKKAETQLREYFAGKRTEFDLPLDPVGTEFQRTVWSLLTKIPYGSTASYGELALQLGDARKARPVGAANGKNPISIIVPCHRVIGMDGALTGFAGGLKNKAFLLDLEQKHVGGSQNRKSAQAMLSGY